MSPYQADLQILCQQENPRCVRIARILGRYSFTGLVSLLKLRFQIDVTSLGDVEVTLFVTIPDRGDRNLSELPSSWTIPASLIDTAEDIEIRHLIERQFQKLWYHEYEESVNYEGTLVRDPHSWEDIEKYHAALLRAEHERKRMGSNV